MRVAGSAVREPWLLAVFLSVMSISASQPQSCLGKWWWQDARLLGALWRMATSLSILGAGATSDLRGTIVTSTVPGRYLLNEGILSVEPFPHTVPLQSALKTEQTHRNRLWDSLCFESFSIKFYLSCLSVWNLKRFLIMASGFYQQNWNTRYNHSYITGPLGLFFKGASLLPL